MISDKSSKHPYHALPPPASAADSATSHHLRPWRLPRRVVVLACIGAVALLWVLGDWARTGVDRSVEENEGSGRGLEEAKLETAVEVDVQLSTGASDEEETVKEETAAPDAADVDPSSPLLEFTPRRPCHALTTTVQPIVGAPSQLWLSPSPPLPLSARLSARLDSWLSSPVSSPQNWTHFNLQTCGNPSVRRNKNKLHARESVETWDGMSEDKVKGIREELAGVLREAETSGPLATWKERGKKGTRGIVWTAGNADTFDRVLVSLRLLRSYGCTLPATVFHFPSEHPSDSQLDDFAALDASVLPLPSLNKNPKPGQTKNFQIKGAALVEAPYDEILMLDSDNLPARDVTHLFDSPEFKEMGMVMWPDYFKDQPENAVWSILGVQCRDEWTIEAGQLLVRKSQHLDALLLVEHMLKDWEFWFRFSDGDKDLFRYAMLALRKRWAVPSVPLSPASWTDPNTLGEQHKDEFAGHTMMQYGLASDEGGERGRPLFVHSNLLKRIVGNFDRTNTWGRSLRLRLPHTAAPSPPSSTSSPSPSQILQADDFANVSPFTGSGIPPPLPAAANSSASHAASANTSLSTREVALLSRSLSMHFWSGHKGAAYVLAVETEWKDELATLSLSTVQSDKQPWETEEMEEGEWRTWRNWVDQEREAECTAAEDVEMAAPRMFSSEEKEEAGEHGQNPVTARKESLRSLLLSSPFSSPLSALSSSPPPLSAPAVAMPSWLEVVLWQDEPDLVGFEDRFYDVGHGKANGNGFR